MGSLDGRIALVTGGGRGIGKAISLALANEGATIAINYRRDKESAETTQREILDAGGLATIHQGSNDIPEENVALVQDVLSVSYTHLRAHETHH
jgi:3-oxoacyl-[acyl-carrier protein] reductase